MGVQTKLLYKLGLGAAWITRALWSEPLRAPSTRAVTSPYVFLITSTINTSNRPLSHSAAMVRSVYSAEERLTQTLGTIQSIRDRVPGGVIILLENSRLSTEQRLVLESAADRFLSFTEDDYATKLCDGPYKNAAEAYVLLRALESLNDYDYRILFKLSGRYLLSDRFDIGRFPLDRFGFLKSQGVVSTRLYSVPHNFRGLYRRQLLASLHATKMGVSFEDVIARGLTPQQIQLLDPIGVCGTIAVDAAARIDE